MFVSYFNFRNITGFPSLHRSAVFICCKLLSLESSGRFGESLLLHLKTSQTKHENRWIEECINLPRVDKTREIKAGRSSCSRHSSPRCKRRVGLIFADQVNYSTSDGAVAPPVNCGEFKTWAVNGGQVPRKWDVTCQTVTRTLHVCKRARLLMCKWANCVTSCFCGRTARHARDKVFLFDDISRLRCWSCLICSSIRLARAPSARPSSVMAPPRWCD